MNANKPEKLVDRFAIAVPARLSPETLSLGNAPGQRFGWLRIESYLKGKNHECSERQQVPGGTIIKVPDATPGILFADGQQHFFTLERVWKSPMAPQSNQVVDVVFDGSGALTANNVVDQHAANKEKLNQLGGAAL